MAADRFTPAKRSEIMSRVRARNTKPEVLLRRRLYQEGLRGYRLSSNLPGSPDIVFTRKKIAIFVDGCFWHGCPKCYTQPQSNTAFWEAKLRENRARDARVTKILEESGWVVLRFWEHEVEKHLDECVRRIRAHLHA